MAIEIEMNDVLRRLPKHLLDLVIDQPYTDYTSVDHAVWRYVMRQNVDFLSKVAHSSYLEGLKKTGIGVEEIPHMYGMNRILKEIGWAAVAVDGFIPPQAFMEFQAYNVLVIAADIRNIEHIPYTPAPDIIHEAAGHAPIIADKAYSDYLKLFGEIGAKAFSSKKDYELYEAIRHLSIVKEDPSTEQAVIDKAEEHILYLQKHMGAPSEMSRIRNLHWWTVEYGLIGNVDDYKIYGAGLLSSIGESANCIDDEKVKKLPYSLDAVNYNFDITTEQPQLFVTPSFEYLNEVLLEFANSMAFMKGGAEGLDVAIESNNLGTVELNTGLQIGGVVENYIQYNNEVIYIKATGPTQLAVNNKQLNGHDKNYHAHGYSTILGRWKGFDKNPSEATAADLKTFGVEVGKQVKIEYVHGATIDGVVKDITYNNDKLLLISFENCNVTYNNEVWFAPEWGVFDLGVGESVTSVFSGVPDSNGYELSFEPPKEKTHKLTYSEDQRKLQELYQKIRDYRSAQETNSETLLAVFQQVKAQHKGDWLLCMELLELAVANNLSSDFINEVKSYLENQKNLSPAHPKLINDGLRLVEQNMALLQDI
jgi:phenylalanine-4-hydroxylase